MTILTPSPAHMPDIAALTGVHAATVCPMSEDGEIHEADLARHVTAVSEAPAVRGLLVNGHAGEGHLLSAEERRRVLDIVLDVVPSGCFITAGVTAESTAAAVSDAVAAAESGADAILVFPPNHWAMGLDDTIVMEHHSAIAAASGLPLVLYKAPLGWGHLSYSAQLLSRLCSLDAVAGIKEGAWDVAAYEELWRRIKVERPGVAVMASGDEHLMACYQVGTDGSQVSLAALFPGQVTGLFDAAKTQNWRLARQLHEGIYPLAAEIYRRAPAYLATARLKAGLKILGRIGSDRVKRPMRQLLPGERDALCRAITMNEDTSR